MNIKKNMTVNSDNKDIADLIKEQSLTSIEEIIENNSLDLNLLNGEVQQLIKNKWVYMKNKKVYYNNDVVSLFPDLNTFVIGYCPVYNEFDEKSLKLRFEEYQGRIPTYSELLKIFDDKGCIQGIQFYNYTIFLNGIRWVDKDEREIVREFNSDNPYLSYVIPIFELGSEQSLIDENGYDLKYVDERKSINNLLEIINLWLKYDLIPDGLSTEAEEIYNYLLLEQRKVSII